jgi:hypothetical protein
VPEQDSDPQHPIFHADADQFAMLFAILDVMPGHRDGVAVAIHPKGRAPWVEQLLRRGVRVHPELMEELPAPGEHPEAAWLNPANWVPRAKYPEAQEQSSSTPEQQKAQLHQILEAVNPVMAQQIRNMTPEQREQARQEQAKQLPLYMAQLNQIGAEFMKVQQQLAEQAATKEES